MSRKKIRNFLAVVFIGLFFMSYEPIFLWLLLGLIVLFSDEDSVKSKKADRSKSVFVQIGDDARAAGLQMPRRPQFRGLLTKLYRKYNKSVAQYPHLKDDLKEVLDEMWAQLAQDPEAQNWESIIRSVIEEWPDPVTSNQESIQEKLSRVNKLTRQWDEARNEALGL